MPNSPDNETPEEDFARFEDFIEDMPDLEFEERLNEPRSEGGFSDKQKKLILEMRETLDEEKGDILDDYSGIGYEDRQIEIHRDSLRNFYSRWK